MADMTTPTFDNISPTSSHDQSMATPPSRPIRGNSRELSTEKMQNVVANSPSSQQPPTNKLAKSASGTSANTMSSLAEQFHSAAGTLRSTTEDDQTLHSCADTLVGDDDLHSLTDTLNDPRDLGSDDEFFSDQMLPRDSTRNSRNFDD